MYKDDTNTTISPNISWNSEQILNYTYNTTIHNI
jgi:hypothetical protein